VNITGEDTNWYEIVYVEIGNTSDIYPHGDTIPVAKSWLPPERRIGGVPETIGRKILDAIDAGPAGGGRYSAAARAPGESNINFVPVCVLAGYVHFR
jgi:hypothetical protein